MMSFATLHGQNMCQLHRMIRRFQFFKRPVSTGKVQAAVRGSQIRVAFANDVVLYTHKDKRRFFALVGVASVSQFVFWSYLGHFAFTELRAAPTNATKDVDSPNSKSNKATTKNLASFKLRAGLAAISIGAGFFFLITGCLYATRNVKHLSLLRQGKGVMFTVYTPWGSTRTFVAQLEDVSSRGLRPDKTSHIPLKVKDHRFFYLLDKDGKFPQPSIFDRTVGIRRF